MGHDILQCLVTFTTDWRLCPISKGCQSTLSIYDINNNENLMNYMFHGENLLLRLFDIPLASYGKSLGIGKRRAAVMIDGGAMALWFFMCLCLTTHDHDGMMWVWRSRWCRITWPAFIFNGGTSREDGRVLRVPVPGCAFLFYSFYIFSLFPSFLLVFTGSIM